MRIRALLQDKPVAGVAFVVALLLLSVWITLRHQAGAAATYYDVQSGELFAYSGDENPPVPAPSGGEGVLARVYACGRCTDKDARFIGYLEKYTEKGKEQIRRHEQATAAYIEQGPSDNPPPQPPDFERVMSVVIDGEPGPWISIRAPAAIEAISDILHRCPGDAKVVRCTDL